MDDRQEDRRGALHDTVFEYREGKDGRVMIYWQGRQVTVLRGKQAAQFLVAIARAGGDGHAEQLVMARATGNFKRGNERDAKQRGR